MSGARIKFIVLNHTFNNISVVEETGVSAENHRPATSHWITLSHVVCIAICKSNFLVPSCGFTTCCVAIRKHEDASRIATVSIKLNVNVLD